MKHIEEDEVNKRELSMYTLKDIVHRIIGGCGDEAIEAVERATEVF
jgi:hypothetical protein